MKNQKNRTIILIACICATAVSGCGGGKGATPVSQTDTTAADQQAVEIAVEPAISCEEVSENNEINSIDDIIRFWEGNHTRKQLVEYIETLEENDFIAALKRDRANISDSMRVEMVVESKMYKEPTSEKADYVTLFNYLICAGSEEYREGIVGYIYKMFRSYPQKMDEFEYYLNQLDEKLKRAVAGELMGIITFEFLYQNIVENQITDLNELWQMFCTDYPNLCKLKYAKEYFEAQYKSEY